MSFSQKISFRATPRAADFVATYVSNIKKEPLPREKMVSIFGNGSTTPDGCPGAKDEFFREKTKKDYENAYLLSKLLALHKDAAGNDDKMGVVTGANSGTMNAANQAAVDNNAWSAGVNMEINGKAPDPNKYIDDYYVAKDFYDRQGQYRQKAAHQVVCPGGIGTFIEFYDALGNVLAGKCPDPHQKQVVLMDKEYWRGLFQWMADQPIARGYIPKKWLAPITIVDTPEEAVAALDKGLNYQPTLENVDNLFQKLNIPNPYNK